MIRTALITGASSGIGEALARHHAKREGNLILVARREDALQNLKAELEDAHGVTVHIYPMDIGTPDGAKALHQAISADGHAVNWLINSAGFGGQGAHIDRDLDEELSMIDLNVGALVTLCHLFGRDMAERGEGKILNVGSSAGFMPGPNQAVYFATKAFVNSFSQSLDQELRDRGVTVTVLAPGYVETEFAERAGLEGTQMVKTSGVTAEETARLGWEGMRAGELVTFTQKRLNFLLRYLQPFLPRRAILSMAERMQAK